MTCYSCATERPPKDDTGKRDPFYKLMDQWYCADCADDEVRKWNEIVATEAGGRA